jgi:hypothetical protein
VHAKFSGNSKWLTPETTLSEYIHKYAPAKDKNKPVEYTEFMADKFNQLLGENVITKDTPVSDIKEALLDAGYDADHIITQAHLSMENPRILRDLNITFGKTVATPAPMPEARKAAAAQKKPAVKAEPPKPAPQSNYNFGATINTQPVKAQPAKTDPKVTLKPAPKVASKPVAKKEEEPFFKMPNFSISDFTLPDVTMPNVKVDVNFKTTGAVGKWLYETLAPVAGKSIDEDVVNIFDYLQNGGSIFDVKEIYKGYKAKKGGSEESDLIGESKKMTPAVDVQAALSNWGYYEKPAESLAKKKYVIDTKQISDSPSVDQDVYTSRAFILNLKNNTNKFSLLDNIHGKSGIKDIAGFYKNFQPVNGSIVFTMQNDQVSNQKPLTTINKNDKWYEGSEYLVKLNSNNTVEVAKTSSLKEGDNVFKLKDKIFSFDDFDIKDGKIRTIYHGGSGGINALIPAVKSDAKTYKKGSTFTIGLTDKKKEAGYLPIDEATQYGRSRGGSFILFSEDLSQQYMVGGSFKNLYDFYLDVKKLHPDKKFKVFASDTGSYSNSFFPKSGKIDGNVYNKSNIRNTWGEVQHMVLMN